MPIKHSRKNHRKGDIYTPKQLFGGTTKTSFQTIRL